MSEAAVTAEETTEKKSRKGIGGPNTKEGKERIRLNALKMGLHANSIEGMQAVGDVVGVTFDEIHEKMLGYYQPADPVEEALVRRIARCSWKLIVIETIEDYAFNWTSIQHSPSNTLESLSIIERRTDVQLHRAIAALATKRKREQEKVKNKLADLPLSSPSPDPRPPTPAAEPSAAALKAAFRARPSFTHLDLPKPPNHPLRECDGPAVSQPHESHQSHRSYASHDPEPHAGHALPSAERSTVTSKPTEAFP